MWKTFVSGWLGARFKPDTKQLAALLCLKNTDVMKPAVSQSHTVGLCRRFPWWHGWKAGGPTPDHPTHISYKRHGCCMIAEDHTTQTKQLNGIIRIWNGVVGNHMAMLLVIRMEITRNWPMPRWVWTLYAVFWMLLQCTCVITFNDHILLLTY